MNFSTIRVFLKRQHLTGRFLNSRVSLHAEEITITDRISGAGMQEKQGVEVNATGNLSHSDSSSKVQEVVATF